MTVCPLGLATLLVTSVMISSALAASNGQGFQRLGDERCSGFPVHVELGDQWLHDTARPEAPQFYCILRRHDYPVVTGRLDQPVHVWLAVPMVVRPGGQVYHGTKRC